MLQKDDVCSSKLHIYYCIYISYPHFYPCMFNALTIRYTVSCSRLVEMHFCFMQDNIKNRPFE